MSSQNYCRPLWQEGMFLAPQHLQRSENYRDEIDCILTAAQAPFPWGIKEMELDESLLGTSHFALNKLVAISATEGPLCFPGNIDIPSRSFEGMLSASRQETKVYLGVPDYNFNGQNLTDGTNSNTGAPDRLKYYFEDVKFVDENTGISEKTIQIRKIRGKILFEGEDTQGYRLLPLTKIKTSPNTSGAIIDNRFIPPILSISAWPPLKKSIESIAAKITSVHSNLSRALGSKSITEWCSNPRGIELTLKQQAANQAFLVLQQISHTGELSPYQVYTELLRTIGLFWAFKGGESFEKFALYDHENLGECFTRTIDMLHKLCTILDARGYIRRAFVASKGRMQVDLDPEWPTGKYKLYLCIYGAGTYDQVVKRMTAIKVCAPAHFEQVLQRRVQAIQVQWLRHPPSSLPAADGAVYAEIIQADRFWPGVQTERSIAVGSAEPFPFKLDLFVE